MFKLVEPGRLEERCKMWPLDGAEVETIVIFILGATNDSNRVGLLARGKETRNGRVK